MTTEKEIQDQRRERHRLIFMRKIIEPLQECSREAEFDADVYAAASQLCEQSSQQILKNFSATCGIVSAQLTQILSDIESLFNELDCSAPQEQILSEVKLLFGKLNCNSGQEGKTPRGGSSS